MVVAVSVVAAAAGYGKTTALRGSHPDARWHRGLPTGGGDPCAALAGVVLEEARGGASQVVFDDLPPLPAGTVAAVSKIVEGTADVALASRWPGPRADVGPASLALTVDQVAALVPPSDAARIHAATAGWPVLVQLAAGNGEPLGSPDGAIAEYLAEEVLPSLPEPARRLLTHLGDLAPVGADLCASLGHPSSALRHLVRSGLLTTAGSPPSVPGGPPPCLRVVPVVAAVLASSPPRAKAAVFFDQHGPPVAAAREYLRGGDRSSCARVLATHGDSMLAAGAAEEVASLVAALPPRTPELWLLLGDAHRAAASLGAAERAYAASGLPATSPALAWRLGRIHYQRGDATAALTAFAAGQPASGPDAVQLAAWSANAHLLAGSAETALASARRAIALAADEPAAVALAHVSAALCLAATGDDAASEEHYGIAVPAAERAGDVVLLTRIFINKTFRLLRAARFEAALAAGRTCARYAAVAGQPSLQAIAACNEGDVLAMLGRFDEAVRCFETAIAGYHRTGSRRVAGAQLGLGEVYRRRGWREQARAAFEAAIRVATEAGNNHVLGPARNGLALVLLDDDPERAAAIAAPGTLADGWLALRAGDEERAAAVADERCAAARDDGDRVALADALELRGMLVTNQSVALRECHGIWAEAGAVVEAARLVVIMGRMPGSGPGERLRRLVAIERLREAGAVVAPEEPSADVLVRAFGRFEVLVRGEPMPARRWQSKKARDLLRILVARRGRPIPRDELCELLWPGATGAGHRLSVLLSILRGVLDDAGPALVADPASVALDVTRIRVDVEDFLAYVAQARRLVDTGDLAEARALLATIDRHHTGEEAFGDEPYAAWAAGLREEARAAQLRMLRMSVQVTDNVDAAAGLLLRLLDHDPYDETAHRGLVRRLVAAGRHGEARRAFDRYVAAMRSIGVRPPDETLLSGSSRFSGTSRRTPPRP